MTEEPALPGFDPVWYAETYRDVGQSGLTPAEHYRQIGSRLGRPPRADCDEPVIADHAVILHVYHLDCIAELAEALCHFPPWADVYVSYPRDWPEHSAEVLRVSFPQARLLPVENAGQDLGAFFQVLRRIDTARYEFFCKLHSKKGDKYPSIWRQALLSGVAGSAERVAAFAQAFRDDPDILIGGPRELFLDGPGDPMGNRGEMERILSVLQMPPTTYAGNWGFFAGSMLWLRRELAETLARGVTLRDFRAEAAQPDFVHRYGRTAHAIERLLGLVPGLMKGKVALASCLSTDSAPEVTSAVLPEPGAAAVPMRDLLADLHDRRIAAGNRALLTGERPGLGFTRSSSDGGRRDFSIVTPTGDRLVAFHRCAVMVASQTIRPREWVVVDDGQIPLTDLMPLPEGVRYVRRAPAADDPPHTLARNMLAALDHITTDRVVIMEDDDWYSPLYAEYMVPLLDHHDLIGLNEIRYYHLTGMAWKNGHPPAHTAFAQTAFRRGPAWDHLAAVCRKDLPEIRERGIVDRHWWKTFEGPKLLLQGNPGLHVGFKGGFGHGSGRRGLASGHERGEVDYIPDPDGAHLSGLIGCDLPGYARWTRRFRKPYVVYTACEGAFSCPPPPESVRLADFFAFTDHPQSVAAPWQALPLETFGAGGGRRAALPMVFPHLQFPEYEWSFWCPAGERVPPDLDALVAEAIEARAAIRAVPVGAAGRGKGLLRRHNDPAVGRAMRDWWDRGGEPGDSLD